jgi:hypothetical protein
MIVSKMAKSSENMLEIEMLIKDKVRDIKDNNY